MTMTSSAVWAAAGAALAIGASGVLADCPPYDPGSPADIGQWEVIPGDSPAFIGHAAHLPNGKLLLYSGEVEQNLPRISGVWDPRSNTWTQQTFEDDMFCAGQISMPDGRVLVAGGSDNPGEGITATNIFDPSDESWNVQVGMQFPRWYPCLMTRSDGKMMVMSGTSGFYVVPEVEVFDPATLEWTTLPPSANKSLLIYPSMHMMPDGRFIYTGTSWPGGNYPPTSIFDPVTNTWEENIATHIYPDRTEAFSVLVPPLEPGQPQSKFMVVGGYADNQRRVEMIDVSDPDPAWRLLPDTTYGRNNCNGVILPDGTVAIVGGLYGYKWGDRTNSWPAEIFDPATETWKVCASMSVPMQYHSIALLLPDGRVLKAGGHDGGGINLMKLEVFSPPYLFRGDRPVISEAPEEVGFGRTFTVETAQAETITKVTAMRLNGITHHTNPDQRLIPLAFESDGKGALTVTAPASPLEGPPGYYMLFILNECGVPSEARYINIRDAVPCYADFNADGDLNLFDFLAYVTAFNAKSPEANCVKDESWDLFDFLCFTNTFNEGC
jgi:hypothetical protein